MTRLAALGTHARSLSGYYRFLSEGKWRLEVLFRCLFTLVVKTFRLADVTLVLDDTLCPKWGRSIFGTGSFFDHVSRPRPGYVWGHNWVVLAIVVPVGSTGCVALPFWISLYRPEKSCAAGEFRTRHGIAAEALGRVREWFPGPITLLADGAYYNRSLVVPATQMGIEVVSRIRSDARLREPSPPRRARHTRGRPATRGDWIPKVSSVARGKARFVTRTVAIYGRKVTLLVREFVGYWPPLDRVVKVVITKDPRQRRRVAYLSTTNLALDAVTVVESFARRWSIEQLFAISKNTLGLDSAEVRKERSVIRHAAFCMALATWTEVWAHRRNASLRCATFSRKLAALREETVIETVFASGPRTQASRRIAQSLAAAFCTATEAA